MNKIQRIAILGTGLLGCSLAKIWKQHREENHSAAPFLVGYDFDDALREAQESDVIDVACSSAIEAVKDADVVILATPQAVIVSLIKEIAPYLRSGTIVTDVGSVKTPVLEAASAWFNEDVHFIGGHPMAGSEKSGARAADAFLFENATWVLCPPDRTDIARFRQKFPAFISLLEQTGARFLVMDAKRHDRIAATISHLPQLLSVALMNLAAEKNQNDEAFLQLAAGGFRDLTRIASSGFPMWRDILKHNQTPVLEAIEAFSHHLALMSHQIREGNMELLESAFVTARTARNTIPKHSKGFLLPLADVYVFARDRPGFLLHLTQTIYDAKLNIKDIELLKIREGTGGAFRVGFQTDEEAGLAVAALEAADYHAYRL